MAQADMHAERSHDRPKDFEAKADGWSVVLYALAWIFALVGIVLLFGGLSDSQGDRFGRADPNSVIWVEAGAYCLAGAMGSAITGKVINLLSKIEANTR